MEPTPSARLLTEMQKYPMAQVRFRVPPQAVLCAAALVAIFPMLLNGPSCGHDFDFHLLSWLEASKQFAAFHYPHWAFTPAWNAGEPRFIFYPPLSWALGGLLGLILPWTIVPAAFTWIALTISGLTMHRLASRHASPPAALLAATLYLANPYMLFTAYERTAYGELLAAAWIPLLFAAALAPGVRILPIAIPLALIWLTNAPAAVMSSYALAFLIAIRLIRGHSEQSEESPYFALALRATAGVALALSLAAFYIVPAAYEQRFVQVNMIVTEGMRPADHFLFHRMAATAPDAAYHDQVVHTASLIALTLLALIVLAAIAAPKKSCHPSQSGGPASRIWPLLLLALLLAFLLTPPSLFLWNHVPKLAFLQFPWRLCALLAVIMATFAAQALDRLPALPSSLLPLPLALVLVLPAWHFFHLPCDPDDAVPARVALFQHNGGAEPTDEYTPSQADNEALRQNDPPYWLTQPTTPVAPSASSCPSCPPVVHLNLVESAPQLLVLNLRAYPTWQVTLNGQAQPTASLRQDGLITVPLPAGPDTVDITYQRTPDQNIGLAISALAAATALALSRKKLSTLYS